MRPFERIFSEDEKEEIVVGAYVFLAYQRHGVMPPPASISEHYREMMGQIDEVVEELVRFTTSHAEDDRMEGDHSLWKSMTALTIGKGGKPARASDPWTLDEATCKW